MAVFVPHGVLFRGGAEGRIREALIRENLLDAVIGLPEKLFFGTGIPAAILVFRKFKADDSVIFIDASREFEAGTNQNTLTSANLDRITATYRAREIVDKYAYRATLADIEGNDFNLNIPRYVSALDTRERRQMRENDGSKTTVIYLQAKLAHLDPIRKALDEEWWPQIQMHCDRDLRLRDPKVDEEWAQAASMMKK
jgi:type I restriction-modification system DNA methylase subunit